jgi:hypothetical protein
VSFDLVPLPRGLVSGSNAGGNWSQISESGFIGALNGGVDRRFRRYPAKKKKCSFEEYMRSSFSNPEAKTEI